MKKALTIVLVAALVSLFGGTLWYLWRKSQKPVAIYDTEQPSVADIVKKTVATGSVIPRKEVAVKPQVSGIIEKILVEPGQDVRRGDLLATIRVVPNTAALAAAESRVHQAEFRSADAEREFERLDQLAKDGVVSDKDLRAATLARDTAKEEHAASQDSLEVVRRGVAARSGNVSNTRVVATIDGTVLDVPVKEGSSVIESNTFNDGTTIATLADMSALIFEGKVDESEVGKLRPGMAIVLTIGALEPAKFDAVLEHIAPKGVDENGAIQFKIRAAVKQTPDVVIRANYSANADIVLDRRDKVLALKESLLQFDREQPFVEVETGPQKFEKRKLKTGLSDGVTIEIVEGLTKDDRVKAGVHAAAPPPS
ncbi:MAG TPA: efflux RND transporter periplasmic adaptor subunit [Candidatus Polarisedimenticolaceae bacterium]|nr:efflux RND transporter periplasmic adaptor subunit [Candidatus Polarisedimenticolaceae bacterium]